MKCSNIIGTLVGVSEPFQREGQDDLLIGNIAIKEKRYPMVFGKSFTKFNGKRVNVLGHLKSDRVDGRLFTYFKALDMEEVDDSISDCNNLIILGQIVSLKETKIVKTDGVEVKPFILKYYSYRKHRNVVHCVAKDFVARQMDNMKVGDTLEIEGYLKQHYNSTIEVEALRIIAYREEGLPCE